MEVKNDFHVLCDVNVVDSSFFMHADRDVKRDNLFQHEIRFGYYVTAIPEKDLFTLLLNKLKTMLSFLSSWLLNENDNEITI